MQMPIEISNVTSYLMTIVKLAIVHKFQDICCRGVTAAQHWASHPVATEFLTEPSTQL